MSNKLLISLAFVAVTAFASGTVLACGGEDSGKHIGTVSNVNQGNSTFTIKDMESQKPITFKANEEIMSALAKKSSGQVMVNYEENDEGGLTAVGVTF